MDKLAIAVLPPELRIICSDACAATFYGSFRENLFFEAFLSQYQGGIALQNYKNEVQAEYGNQAALLGPPQTITTFENRVIEVRKFAIQWICVEQFSPDVANTPLYQRYKRYLKTLSWIEERILVGHTHEFNLDDHDLRQSEAFFNDLYGKCNGVIHYQNNYGRLGAAQDPRHQAVLHQWIAIVLKLYARIFELQFHQSLAYI